jgi:adenine/guanine/hypoxanthine permease
MIPGSAVGVFLGDLIYTILAFRLARKTGRTDLTAMPLGIDTPSLFAFSFGIVGPAYLATRDAELTWKISTAVIVCAGLLKMLASIPGPAIRSALPRAALLGPIAAVAILLIAFFASIKIIHSPLVGFASLSVILVCFVGRVRLPFGIPAALAAVGIGLLIHHAGTAAGIPMPEPLASEGGWRFSIPYPTLDFLEGLPLMAPYLTLAIPFALAVVVGGIDVTESAAAAGDDYSTRSILMTDGIATAVSGLCGGVLQTTPYIGHPAYKHMGGGAGYTLATALFIGSGAVWGFLSIIVGTIPEAAAAPILIFIGIEIMAQSFHSTPKEHFAALALAFLPVAASLVLLQERTLLASLGVDPSHLSGEASSTHEALLILGNGFIISSLLWASALSAVIDRHFNRAAFLLIIAGFLSLFGIIHSPFLDGALFWPWRPESRIPLIMAASYLIGAGLTAAIGRTGKID